MMRLLWHSNIQDLAGAEVVAEDEVGDKGVFREAKDAEDAEWDEEEDVGNDGQDDCQDSEEAVKGLAGIFSSLAVGFGLCLALRKFALGFLFAQTGEMGFVFGLVLGFSSCFGFNFGEEGGGAVFYFGRTRWKTIGHGG